MKITSMDIIMMPPTKQLSHPVICRINTDEGIYGIGESGVAIVAGGTASAELMKDFAPMIIGMNPLYNDLIWEKLYRGGFWTLGNGGVVMAAVSAIDCALWDIKGKYYNAPVYELLGGKHRDKLRAYASQLQFGWHIEEFGCQGTVEQYVDAAKKAMSDGYDAIKVNFITNTPDCGRLPYYKAKHYLTHDVLRYAEERLAAVRETVGPDVDIICENHAMTDVTTAVQFANMAAKYDIMFLEEAAAPMNPQVMKTIADRSPIPLATGERSYTRWGFLPFLQSGCLSVIQPDIGNCGGITEARKIADMAHTYDVSVQGHTCSSPISVAISLHLEAAIPNFIIHEHHVTNTMKSTTRLARYDYQPVNGYFDLPDLPGIGNDLSDWALENSTIVTVD